jgi:3-hydroxybutyryl-CoA dehydrogenase
MGAGVAHAFLLAGAEVRLAEVDDAAAEAAQGRVAEAVAATAERGRLDDSPEAVLGRLHCGVGPESLSGCELVVEAVPEDAGLKIRMLGAVAEVLAPDAVLATNTSSISIDEMATALPAPERFLGMHFFNPVPASKLVEIVVGQATDAALVERAQGWVRAIGKTPVTVADAPGFASSRLGLALGLEAIRMLGEGVASAEDIDAAMTLGYRHPIGPLALTDLVGLDVRLSIAEYLADKLGPRFEPPQLLREKVAAGELGRKSGRGFFDYG